MNYQVKKLEKSNCEVEISLNKEELMPLQDKIVEEIGKDAEIPGFRKGKAPKDAVLNQFKTRVEEKLVDKVLNEKFPEVIKNENLKPISYADIKEVSLKDESLKISFLIDLYPEFELANYKNLGLEKTNVEVTEDVVNKEIEFMLERSKKLEEVSDENHEAVIGDTIDLAFEGFVDGVAFEGGKAEHYDLVLGSHSFIDNFEDQLVGYKKGQEGEVNVKFPEEYHSKDLAGKPAVFKVKVHSIKKSVKPELNEEFVKEKGYDTIEAFKEAKKLEIEKLEAERAENEFIGKILEKVSNDSNIIVPESMILFEVEQRLREFEYQLSMQGMKLEDYVKMTGGEIKDLIEQIKPMAEQKVKTDLILQKISEEEKIEASEEELKEKTSEIAKMYGMEVEKLEAELNKNNNLNNFKASVKSDIQKKKAIDHILANQ